MNQSGDFAFVGEGGTAVFFLSHTAASGTAPTRVLQYGDEVPGFSGSRITAFSGLQLNNTGLLAFTVNAELATGQALSAILSYNTSNGTLQDLADTTQEAPGLGGPTYSTFTLLGLDDSDDFAFLSGGNDLFISMAEGTPVLAASVGEAAPGTSGTFSAFGPSIAGGTPLVSPTLNNSGQLLIAADISGGAGGTGLFVISTAGIRKVVANGDANPVGGLFTITPATAWAVFNNAGQVAFVAGNPAGSPAGNSLFINTPTSATAGTTTTVAAAGSASPGTLGGTLSFIQTLITPPTYGWLNLDDNGDIVAVATVSGGSTTGALLRFTASPANSATYTTSIVAYYKEAAPGVTGTFTSIKGASINNSGLVSFGAELTGTPTAGIFQQAAGGALSLVVLDGAATGLAGGGDFEVSADTSLNMTATLNDGTVYFPCAVINGTANYGDFLWKAGVLRTLMDTGQPLPAGANVALGQPSAAGTYVAYLARYAGGQANLVVHNIATQATQTVAYEGEAAPGTSGYIGTLAGFYVNSKGHVAFQTLLAGFAQAGQAIYVAVPGTGISKVVATGDPVPSTGDNIGLPYLPLNSGNDSSPFNASDQVAFYALTNDYAYALFMGAPGVAPVLVVPDTALDVELDETTNISLNNQGAIAFVTVPPGTLTVTSTGTTPTPNALYAAMPTGTTPPYTLTQIAESGDSAPGGGTFGQWGYPSANNSGQLVAAATLTGASARAGIFTTIGSGGAVALDGTPTPAGPNFNFSVATILPKINDENDITFEAPYVGGGGLFVSRGASISAMNPFGVLQEPIQLGQAAPGSSGTFSSLGTPILGETGDIAFQGQYTTGSAGVNGLWHLETTNTVEAILVQGTVATDFGGGTVVTSTPGTAWNSGVSGASGGQFPVYGVVSGGTFLDGIFLFEPGIATNTPAGVNVPVAPTDSTTGTTPVSLTFANVGTAGSTSLTIASGGPTLPTGFAIGNPPVFYNISSSAAFSGSVTVCINTAGVSFSGSQNLELLHFNGTNWVNITTSVSGGTICGSTTSFSPFAVASVSQVSVPNVVGETQAAATTAITGAGLTVGTVTSATSATVPSGSVISEDPAAGTSVNAGTAVNLVVSSGSSAQVTVPNVVGDTQAAATTAITGAGLTLGTVTTASSATVASGDVISEDPAAGTSVNAGSSVNLVVSSGPSEVTVPNVVGDTQAAATTAITGAGLTVGTVTTASSTTVASGDVISEDPVAGTSVNTGSAVNFVVSSGPPQPAVSLPSTLTFPAQTSGTTSSAQTVTLTNTGKANLTFTAISVTGPFAIASSGTTCSTASPVAANGTCTVALTFAPTAGGSASGSISFSDNAPNSPQTVMLSGTGQDFSFAPPSGSSSSATVAPGSPAAYTLSVGGEGGLSGSVAFTCTGAPSEATCTVSPNPATAGSTATNVTVTVTTTAPSSAPRPLAPMGFPGPGPKILLILALVLVLVAWAVARRNRQGISGWRANLVPLALALLFLLGMAGCGGGGGGGGGTTTSNAGTPAGTYTLTVTGTTGSGTSAISHSVTLTLTVS